MPIDVSKALDASLPDGSYSWDANDVILYHLGVGAGVPATDPNELEYVYEANLKVLPSFASIVPFGAMMGVTNVDGLDFNLAMLLHGEQEVTLFRPIPPDAKVTNQGRIAGIYDKGKGALVVVDIDSRDAAGDLLFTNRSSLFLRGEGGFGGEPGPPPRHEAPDREPDHVVESVTLEQQALLYRLSGDRNPLHVDPAFAAIGGFDRPILHGLCSYGIVCKAVVDTVLAGDVSQVHGYSARFSGPVVPGETIVTKIWESESGFLVEAITKQRQSKVISNANLTVFS
ncbi:MAG: MaoC family dehydratase N-terminal domain-containing protein [Acidimicrobiia bacterium]|nr:MaoC family dehydratase N-terminal domain-containing protein [Acidimicrobiia bacterium]